MSVGSKIFTLEMEVFCRIMLNFVIFFRIIVLYHMNLSNYILYEKANCSERMGRKA